MFIEIRPHPFAPWQEIADYEARLQLGSFGACAVFVGYMRDFNLGQSVTAMTLEHYSAMTEHQLGKVVENSITQHDLIDVLVLHRIGDLIPGEPIVVVAVWSAHRAEAFMACREIMENLKSRATLWKKERISERECWVEPAITKE